MGEARLGKTMSAGAWTAGGYVLSQLFRFGGNLILTRLLLPEYFGIMGIVTVVIIGLTMFSDLGILQCVVQSRNGESRIFLNTAWTVQVIRGLILSAVMLALGYLLVYLNGVGVVSESSVYGHDLLPEVIMVLSIVPLLNGLESTKIHLANRFLDLKSVTIIEVVSQLVGLTLMVVLAWMYASIWSLVAGVLLTALVKMLLSHLVLVGPSNSLGFDRAAFREIFDFGKWIVLASISGFFLSQGDRLLLGGLVDAESLGIYTIAYFLASALLLGLAKLNRTVFFPVLSRIAREEPSRLKDYYYDVRKKTDILVFSVAGGLFVSGDSIIRFLYDARYADAGWMLEILGLSIIGMGAIVADQVFLAFGKSGWMSLTSIVQMLTLYIGVPSAYYLSGFESVIWVISLAFLPKYVLGLYFLNKAGILALGKEFRFIPVFVLGYMVGLFVDKVFGWILPG